MKKYLIQGALILVFGIAFLFFQHIAGFERAVIIALAIIAGNVSYILSNTEER